MQRTRLVPALALAISFVAGAAGATTYAFDAVLSGLEEAPPNASPATGFGHFVFDDAAHTLAINLTYEGLLGPNIAAHIHAPTTDPFTGTAPVATVTPTFTGFPSGTTAGSYSHIFDMTLASSYRTAFLNGFGGDTLAAEAAIRNAAIAGKSYVNIHSTVFTGGEIRGFLVAVPEPATWGLMIAGFGLAGVALRRRRVAA